MQAGYDAILQLINITPDFNLIDVGLGLNGLLAFDDRGGSAKGRPVNARITPGFEANWNLRLYVLPIPPIKSAVFLEGLGMTFIVYSREYPDNGTKINIGSHVGLGVQYPINKFKGYTTLRLFHSSNGKQFEHNPALNAIGLLMGIRFK